MIEKMEELKAKVEECIVLAKSKWFVTLPNIDIRFDLKGKSMGQARRDIINGKSVYSIRFNINAMKLGGKSYTHILNCTVPHEVAHIICMVYPMLGNAHNKGWKLMCLALGGDGNTRCNISEIPEAIALIRPYAYKATDGTTVNISKIQHKKIQNGIVYRTISGKGLVSLHCEYVMSQVRVL